MLRQLKEFWMRALVWRRNSVLHGRHLGVTIGEDCRILDNARRVFGSEPYLVSLGDHVTIADGVRFITHDGGVWVFRAAYPNIDVFGSISVGNNVFIGFNVLVLPNVQIGDNCVIGAGSIVTRSIPANSVAVGCPAKPIKTLEEYWDNVKPVALHIRSLPKDEKRVAILRHLGRVAETRAEV